LHSRTTSASVHRHRAFGLSIQSELPLPNLRGEAEGGIPDVLIRLGEIPAHTDARTGLTVFGSAALLNIPGVARFWIADGKSILVDPSTAASERNVRLYLLGSALGAILHQRGIFPLHANAVEISNRAVAFAGHSGAGKSTLAAWFWREGHRILSDDVCAIAPDEELHVAAGLPRLRLWRDALDARGLSCSDLDPSFDGEEKYDLPADVAGPTPSAPLGAVYILTKREGHSEEHARVKRITGIKALNALLENCYRGAFAHEMGTLPQLVQTCLMVSRSVPIFVVSRNWGHDIFDRDASILAEHARQTVG
jgi:hypothetical protein